MGLQEQNTHNCQVKMHNHTSIQMLRKYKLDVKNGPALDATHGMGPPLRPSFAYSKDEMDLMIASNDYYNKVVMPVLPIVFGFIVKDHIHFLAAIKNKVHPPIFWFMDNCLQHAMQFPSSIPKKKNTSGLGKMVLNCEKLIQEWGSDKTATGVMPLQWLNAMENYLTALKQLSAMPRTIFESDFQIWYPVERQLHNKILDNTAFNPIYWHTETGHIVTGWKAPKALRDGNFIVPTMKLSDLAFNLTPALAFNPPQALQHIWENNGNYDR
ncbi:hypothetical protein K438DRAFT_1765689 [Mycena galopus ATCC 62051]|nr:hypothetical protein K438DRAFT_1765689 [Mycena galopus ATCC 62051]